MLSIRHAESKDAGALARMADTLFRTAFAERNDPVQMERYCGSHFGTELQAAEINDPDAITLLLEKQEALEGFAQMLRGARSQSSVDVGTAPVELQRFYVAPTLHGRGVAQILMQRCIEEAETAGADVLWLGVWQENPRAIAFYHKCGFHIAGEQVFMLGTEPQYDHVMIRPLRQEP
jgi:ribosomal protein S18 acetylase RimI-like enzyme